MKSLFLLCLLFTAMVDAGQPKQRPLLLHDWKPGNHQILTATEEKPARTAVLIIAPTRFDKSYTGCRWLLGKKVWEQYMNSVPDVDCYFLQSTKMGSSNQVWVEGNTLYIGDDWYKQHGYDRILHKTIMAIEALLPQYTHFIRTNLNSFLNLKSVQQYAKTHHQSIYTTPLWQNEWYTLGYGIFFTADVAAHMTSEYRRLEGLDIVSHRRADDTVLTSLATGVYPFDPAQHLFRCCPTLPAGVRQLMCLESLTATRLSPYGAILLPPIYLNKALKYCDKAADTVMVYRIREGFDLDELAALYEHLLHRVYPELSCNNLVEYARSLLKIVETKRTH